MKKSFFFPLVVVSLCSLPFTAVGQTTNNQTKESKVTDRVQAAAEVLDQIQGTPDKGIPGEVLGSAECVAVVPSMLKGGFIVGAKYGRGLASCRTPQGWSAPAFFVVTGGSIGFQIGGRGLPPGELRMKKADTHHLLRRQFRPRGLRSPAPRPPGPP